MSNSPLVDLAARGQVFWITDRAFCVGADLQPDSKIFEFDFSNPRTSDAMLLRQAMDLDLPLVAGANGACMAGAMGLLAI